MKTEMLIALWLSSCLLSALGGYLSGYDSKPNAKSGVYHTQENASIIVLTNTNTDTKVIFQGEVFYFNEAEHKTPAKVRIQK